MISGCGPLHWKQYICSLSLKPLVCLVMLSDLLPSYLEFYRWINTSFFFSMLNKSMLKTRIFFYTLNSNLEIYTEAQCWWRLRQIAKFGENIFKANNIRQTISAAQGPWGISEQKCNMNICCKSFIKKVSKEP